MWVSLRVLGRASCPEHAGVRLAEDRLRIPGRGPLEPRGQGRRDSWLQPDGCLWPGVSQAVGQGCAVTSGIKLTDRAAGHGCHS